MRIRRGGGGQSEVINISSLLDVMFILIIFFLATTTFKEEERDLEVRLPRDTEGRALSSQDQVIVINVRKSGAYIVMGRQVNVEEMGALVGEAVAENTRQKVLVRADREALHGYVARAIATCKHAGVEEANIGYEIPR